MFDDGELYLGTVTAHVGLCGVDGLEVECCHVKYDSDGDEEDIDENECADHVKMYKKDVCDDDEYVPA